MEYNEINILSEYQAFNLIFAKQQLLLDDRLCAHFLEVMWRLLEINDDGTPDERRISAAEDFPRALEHKFALMKSLLLNVSSADAKANEAVFSKEQVRRILAYTRETYFKHFRLYDYVLNNKQLVDVKKITVFQDIPMRSPSLNDALALGKEKLEYEDEENEAEEGKAGEVWAEEEKAGDVSKLS